jgi:hypothetical protein
MNRFEVCQKIEGISVARHVDVYEHEDAISHLENLHVRHKMLLDVYRIVSPRLHFLPFIEGNLKPYELAFLPLLL